MPDDHSEVVPLLPIPNRTVKRLCADDSADSRVKVGHRQANKQRRARSRNEPGPFAVGLLDAYMLRRYCPPTSNSAFVICPSEQHPHRVHQHLEHVLVVDHRLLQALQHRRRFGGVALVELGQALELRLLFLFGRARQLERRAALDRRADCGRC